jgi:hypothetical protein
MHVNTSASQMTLPLFAAAVAMLRLCLILLAVSACGHSASAESFAIRCIDVGDMAYFVTFDMDTRKVVFKSAGGNFLHGYITASEAGRIAFTLDRGSSPPNSELVWDGASSTLMWIGAPNNPERRTVKSTCATTSAPDK